MPALPAQARSWALEPRCVQDFRNVMGKFAAFALHLVLLDIALPFYNGYHWCSELRRMSQVPVIFLSSAADNMNVVMAMNDGGICPVRAWSVHAPHYGRYGDLGNGI